MFFSLLLLLLPFSIPEEFELKYAHRGWHRTYVIWFQKTPLGYSECSVWGDNYKLFDYFKTLQAVTKQTSFLRFEVTDPYENPLGSLRQKISYQTAFDLYSPTREKIGHVDRNFLNTKFKIILNEHLIARCKRTSAIRGIWKVTLEDPSSLEIDPRFFLALVAILCDTENWNSKD